MRTMLIAHVAAGCLGLLSGYLALSVSKGGSIHRKAGVLFVCVMLTMSVTGLLISAIQGIAPAINVPTALLTFYLVTTAFTTVRPRSTWSRALDLGAMMVAVATALACFALAAVAIGAGGREAGLAYPLVLFGGIALAGSAGDRRLIRTGSINGAPRLVRHLWRMCVGLFIASIAFYLGPDRLPEALRRPFFRVSGVLLPIVIMTYWLWRLRSRRPLRRLRPTRAPEPA
jgi:hypothetical protein